MLLNLEIFKSKIFKAGTQMMVAGGDNSFKRYLTDEPDQSPSDTFSDEESELHLFRRHGDPILPKFALSSHWLAASHNVSAQQNRVELGLGFLGVSHTQNTLNEPGDTLTLSNTLVHYRMSAGNNFSWDLAWGKGKMNGNQKHTGDVFAMPIRLRMTPDVHLEYYPVWSSYNGGALSEHQLSINWQANKYAGITAGYKKWSAGPTTIEGIFTGLNFSY